MGLDYHGIRLMAYIKTIEPELDSIAMLGRQSLHTDAASIGRIFAEFEIPSEQRDIQRLVSEGNGYCEPLLKHMGFKCIESIDFSDYENPTHIHDFNQTIPAELERRYDLVIDGGSLEHIFNFPTALRNCMRMVKLGGIFTSITPCNNQCGHGFYQFSPELYFSLMRGDNGFKLLDLFCHEINPNSKWHRVIDPGVIKNRVNMVTWRPIMMLVIARRTVDRELPEFRIQQSDYETIWAGECLKKTSRNRKHIRFSTRARRILAKSIPFRLKIRIRELFQSESFPPEFFTSVDAKKGSLLEAARSAQKNP